MAYTRKQIRIILLMAQGLSTAVIAQLLDLSEDTISNQRKRILKKSKCQNWNQFMAWHGMNGQLDEWSKLDQVDTDQDETEPSDPSQ